ncbi:MAG: hypothetical protein Q9227_006423 [Pyrenula ochraceoflavens]
MSDQGRKSVGDQVQEKVTPDSQKSTLDKATESASSTADKVVGSVQPGDTKSTSQKMSDTVRGEGDSAQDSGKGYLAQAQETLGNAANTASETISSQGRRNKTKTKALRDKITKEQPLPLFSTVYGEEVVLQCPKNPLLRVDDQKPPKVNAEKQAVTAEVKPVSQSSSPVNRSESASKAESVPTEADHPEVQGLTKNDVKHLFSGAPHFMLEAGRHGKYFPQVLFPWNNDLDIADLKDRRFLRHESFALATLHAHLPIPDELTYKLGADAAPSDHGKWTRPPFDASVFEVPNMLGCEGKEVGTIGMRHFLELPVADATRPSIEETYGGPHVPKAQIIKGPATETFQHLSHGEGYAMIGKHAPRVDRTKLISGGPKAWKKVGIREIKIKDIADRLQYVSDTHDRLVSEGLKANVLDTDTSQNLYRMLFTTFLYAPAKVVDHEDPYSLKVQIEALVKVLTTPGLWIDFSIVEWRTRLGQLLFENGLHEDTADTIPQADASTERKALLLQIVLSVELLVRLDAAIRIGMVDTTKQRIVTIHEMHHFTRLRNTKVDWDLVLARRFVDRIQVRLTDKSNQDFLPAQAPDQSGGLVAKLRNRLSISEGEPAAASWDCLLIPRRGHIQLEGLLRFARGIDWPSFDTFEENMRAKFVPPPGSVQPTENIYSAAPVDDSLGSPPSRRASMQSRRSSIQSRRSSLQSTPGSYFGGLSVSGSNLQLHPADKDQIGGWLSKSWLTGLVMPGETITHLLIATLLENDVDALDKLGSTATLNAGFVLGDRSWWSKASIMSRVLGAYEGSVECMGWVSCNTVPKHHSGTRYHDGWVKVRTEEAQKLRQAPRIGDGPKMAKQSSVLGSGDGQILASEFGMPLDSSMDSLAKVRVEFVKVQLNDDEVVSAKQGPKPPTASAHFKVETCNGPREPIFSLKHDIHFITGQPCRPPHGHAAAPTEINTDHHLQKKHDHLPAHPLHITYTYELKSIHDIVGEPPPLPPNPCAADHSYSGPWVIDARGSRDRDMLVRAWCSQVGRHAIVARAEKVCLGCCVREARALEVGIIIRVGGEVIADSSTSI